MNKGKKILVGWMIIAVCVLMQNAMAQDGGALAPAVSAKPADPFVKGAIPVQQAAVKAEEKVAGAVVENQQPLQVEMNISLVSFPREEIEAFARKSASASPSEEQILDAWRGGKGRLVASHKMTGQAGQETSMKGVTEHIDPTQYTLSESAGTNGGVHKVLAAVLPGNFETREVGFLTTYTPIISDDGKFISMSIAPEYVVRDDDHEIASSIEARGKVVSCTKVNPPQFHSQKIYTSRIIANGSTVVEGGMLNHDGTEMGYFFITPRVVK